MDKASRVFNTPVKPFRLLTLVTLLRCIHWQYLWAIRWYVVFTIAIAVVMNLSLLFVAWGWDFPGLPRVLVAWRDDIVRIGQEARNNDWRGFDAYIEGVSHVLSTISRYFWFGIWGVMVSVGTAFYRERSQGSLLFWKSLPVADAWRLRRVAFRIPVTTLSLGRYCNRAGILIGCHSRAASDR